MVNLLPWRERNRERSRRRFLYSMAVSALLGLLLVAHFDRGLNASIAARSDAIQSLKSDIALLGERGAEAERLRREQEDAALHMRVLTGLQRSRPVPAQVLSELSLNLPAAAHYRRLSRSGGEVQIEGFADSHAAVAELMRKLPASPNFFDAQLAGVAGVESADSSRGLFEFSLLLLLDEELLLADEGS